MASFNRVVLLGNLTRDPEFRTIQSGTSVAEISLAVNDRRRDANGNWIEEANFFDVTVWARSAEIVRDYTRKGSPLLVEGRLKYDSWEQDGQKRSKVKIIAERVVLVGSRDGSPGNSGGNFQGGGYSQQGGYAQQGGYSQQSGGYPRSNAPQSSRYPNSQPPIDEYSQDGGDDIPF